MRMAWTLLAGAAFCLALTDAAADHVSVGVGIGVGPVYAAPVYAPPVAVQAEPATLAPAAQSWYYCEQAGAYYPYVQACPGGWRAVPAQAAPTGPSRPIRFSLGEALFAANDSRLQPQADAILRGLLDEARRYAGCRIVVEAYAGAAAAATLAQGRAEAVRRYLLDHGVDPARISAVARSGQDAPADTRDSPARAVSVTLSAG